MLIPIKQQTKKRHFGFYAPRHVVSDEDPEDVLHRREKERKKSWGMKDGKYLRPQHTIEADLASEEGRERHQETF